jgi:hypothetical protein
MEDLYELEIDALAIGITKLPQYMGIPIICFYSNCMGWFLGWMFLHDKISNGILGVLLFSLGFCVSHCYMAGETLRDVTSRANLPRLSRCN